MKHIFEVRKLLVFFFAALIAFACTDTEFVEEKVEDDLEIALKQLELDEDYQAWLQTLQEYADLVYSDLESGISEEQAHLNHQKMGNMLDEQLVLLENRYPNFTQLLDRLEEIDRLNGNDDPEIDLVDTHAKSTSNQFYQGCKQGCSNFYDICQEYGNVLRCKRIFVQCSQKCRQIYCSQQ